MIPVRELPKDTKPTPVRDTFIIWLCTGICVLATVVYSALFRGVQTYEDFQGIFPLFLWLVLMALHLWLGSTALYIAWQRRWWLADGIVHVYFYTAFVIHVWLMMDWMGWDERWYTRIQNLLNPADKELHQLLDKNASVDEIAAAIDGGANPNSWRGTWAIWKAYGYNDRDAQNLPVLNELLARGADPDKPSRSRTDHRSFTYRVDGMLEPIFVGRDNRRTLICQTLDQSQHHPSNTDLELVLNVVDLGADRNQSCNLRYRPLTPTDLALLGRHAGIIEAMLQQGPLQFDVEFATERLTSAAVWGDLDLLGAVAKLIPLKGNEDNYTFAIRAAIEEDQPDAVAALLQLGAEPYDGAVADAIENISEPEAIVEQLATQSSPSASGYEKKSPLVLSMKDKDLAMTRRLLELGADPNQNVQRYGTLHETNRIKPPLRYEFIALLIEHGADLERRNNNDHTFLMSAAYRRDYQSAEIALKAGADLMAADRRGRTAADLAIYQKADAQLLSLLGTEAPEVVVKPYEFQSAIQRGRRAQVLEMIGQGADLNSMEFKRSPLEIALAYDQIEIAELLLQNGANPNIESLGGVKLERTVQPTTVSVMKHKRKLAKGQSPAVPLLFATALTNDISKVEALLKHDVSLDSTLVDGDSLGHYLAYHHRTLDSVVPRLISAGMDMTAMNDAGFSPLTFAGRHGAVDLIRVYKDAGIDLRQPDREGRTVLDTITQHGVKEYREQVLLLLGTEGQDTVPAI